MKKKSNNIWLTRDGL